MHTVSREQIEQGLLPATSRLSQRERFLRGTALAVLAAMMVYWLSPIWLLPSGRWIGGHSHAYDLLRSLGVIDAWKHGILDARILPSFDGGFGYPLHALYAPLFSWSGAACLALTGSWRWGMLIATAAWLAIGVAGMFQAGKLFWSSCTSGRALFWAGWLTSVGWLLCPYNFWNIFVRNDGPEFAASASVGWMLWSAMRLLGSEDRQPGRRLALTVPLALAMAGAVLSHNVYGVYCIGFAAAIPVVCALLPAGTESRRRWLRWGNLPLYMLAAALGLGLSAFFWVPAMAEMRYTHVYGMFAVDGNGIGRSLMTPARMFSFELITRAGGSGTGWTCTVGWICIASIASLLGAVAVAGLRRQWNLITVVGVLLVGWLVTLWLMSVYARAFWLSHPMLMVTQFAWRLMPFAELAECLLLPALPMALLLLKPASRTIVDLAYGVLLIVAAARSASVYMYYHSIPLPQPNVLAATVVRTATWNEYATVWQDRDVRTRRRPGEISLSEPLQIVSKSGDFNNLEMVVENLSPQPGTVEVAYSYFPGWIAQDDTHLLATAPGNDGMIRVNGIGPGRHTVRLLFVNTPIRLAMKTLSASIAVLLLISGAAGAYVHMRRSRALSLRASSGGESGSLLSPSPRRATHL